MKKLLKALKEKARNCGVNNKENRARKGAYVDCIVQLEAAINYTHSCKSDSELLLFSADEIVSKINEQTVLDGETFRVYFCEK